MSVRAAFVSASVLQHCAVAKKLKQVKRIVLDRGSCSGRQSTKEAVRKQGTHTQQCSIWGYAWVTSMMRLEVRGTQAQEARSTGWIKEMG